MLLTGKRILVMGLIDTRSIAWAIGQAAEAQGAEVVYTVQNERVSNSLLKRSLRQTDRSLEDLRIICCDVTKGDELDILVGHQYGPFHGFVYSIAFASKADGLLEGELSDAPRHPVNEGFEISAAGFSQVIHRLRWTNEHVQPTLLDNSSVIALTFDSQHTYPNYNWMGVYKAALEATARYTARDLGPHGIRVNCISAGPLNTLSASGITGFDAIGDVWPARAPLGWNLDEGKTLVANNAVCLLSDLMRGVTGEILHVDGGFHSVGIATQ
ncbi:MAG TPA: SDR family oxidoreductase [Patescibacteria group bacterium]